MCDVRDDGYEGCGTESVDMRERIIARMVGSAGYMAAIPGTVADLRAEGDHEGADELERLASDARRRIDGVEHQLPGLSAIGKGGRRAAL